MKLSILIPTLPEPESQNYLKRLLSILNPQVENRTDVEILTHDGPRSMPTGTKRNELIARSQGEYFSQIDCDDVVPIYYVSELLKAITQTPDVITFQGHMLTDGANRKNFTIKLGEKYEERDNHYYRYPNHLSCFRKSIVQHIKFQPIWIQEDYRWATELRDKNILRAEVHIPLQMYVYDYKTKLSPIQQRMRR
jgi:glycosyltransferase involved in cell wall biosynthesis